MPEAGLGISAIIIARDEGDRIGTCLRSIPWADERIVVVDDRTRDATAAIARPLATEVITRQWDGFAEGKEFALSRAHHPWILWVDADEEVDADLASAIREAVLSPGENVGFRVRRLNIYLGHAIRHGAWSDDRVIRLFRRERGRFDDRRIHESVDLDGPATDLRGFLTHRSYRNLSHHWEKIGEWSRLWAEEAHSSGKRGHPWDLIFRPVLRFLKGYFFKAGFLDGSVGVILAFMDAAYVGVKYARLLELQGGLPGDRGSMSGGRDER